MGSDVVLSELDMDHRTDDSTYPKKEHRKHRKKKDNLLSNGHDADIVTPYQNGHLLQPPNANLNGYHKYSKDDLITAQHRGYGNRGDFLSPQPHHLQSTTFLDERGVHSSLSSVAVNNAITVAPSRTNLNDSNVFAGGRPPNLKRPGGHRANNNARHHTKHKGRSRTPDFTSTRKSQDDLPHDSQSILNRIDLSIRKNFGDWDNEDGGDPSKKLFPAQPNNGIKPNKQNRTPYFIPKQMGSDSDVMVGVTRDDLNLPRLFKPYENVVTTSRQVLNDKSYKVCLSRDNADPNSILSQAKKTLSMVSGQS